jgi:hypothetical protein
VKKFLLAAALLLAAAAQANTPVTGGILTNPVANTILVDTGPLDGPANHTIQIFVSSSVNAVVVIENRDSANTANVWTHAFPIGANAPFQMKVDSFTTNGTGERLRIRLNANITGVIQASVITD